MIGATAILRVVAILAGTYAMEVFGSIVVWSIDSVYQRETTPLSEPKKVIDDVFENIVSVTSAYKRLGIVGFEKGKSANDQLGFFVVDYESRQWRKIFERQGLQRVALNADGSKVAFLVCNADACELRVRQLFDAGREEVIATSLTRASQISWSPHGQQLAIANGVGWIDVIDLTTRSHHSLVKGENPSWSADGKRLAYVNEKAIWIYDFNQKKSSKVYQRHFWQSNIVGMISWGPTDVIAFDVAAGIDGYQIDCLLLNTESWRVTVLQRGYLWCGPWLN